MRNVRRNMLALVLTTLCAGAMAAPPIINYNGQLSQGGGGGPVTSATPITFTFWDAATAGNQLGEDFSETDVVTPDNKGFFATLIGDGATALPPMIFASDEVWLNVNVDGEDLVPRRRLTSVPYAINADTASFATNSTYATTSGHASTASVAATAQQTDRLVRNFTVAAGETISAGTSAAIMPSGEIVQAGNRRQPDFMSGALHYNYGGVLPIAEGFVRVGTFDAYMNDVKARYLRIVGDTIVKGTQQNLTVTTGNPFGPAPSVMDDGTILLTREQWNVNSWVSAVTMDANGVFSTLIAETTIPNGLGGDVIEYVSTVALDAENFVVLYEHVGTLRARHGAVQGGGTPSIVWGSDGLVGTGELYYHYQSSMARKVGNSAVFLGNDNDSAIVVIVPGDESTPAIHQLPVDSYALALTAVDDERFAVVYLNDLGQVTVSAVLGNVGGSFGDVAVLEDDTSYPWYVSATGVSGGRLLVSLMDDYYSEVYGYTANGLALEALPVIHPTVAGDPYLVRSLVGSGDGEAVLALVEEPNVSYVEGQGSLLIFTEDLFGPVPVPLGIAAEAGAAGQSVPVVIGGVSSSHSGLTPGAHYFIEPNGELVETTGTLKAGTAISPTELIVRLQ